MAAPQCRTFGASLTDPLCRAGVAAIVVHVAATRSATRSLLATGCSAALRPVTAVAIGDGIEADFGALGTVVVELDRTPRL